MWSLAGLRLRLSGLRARTLEHRGSCAPKPQPDPGAAGTDPHYPVDPDRPTRSAAPQTKFPVNGISSLSGRGLTAGNAGALLWEAAANASDRGIAAVLAAAILAGDPSTLLHDVIDASLGETLAP